MDDVSIRIDEIYVPTKRRHDVRPETVDAIAESIIDEGLKVPISVRRDGQRFVLVAGLLIAKSARRRGEIAMQTAGSGPHSPSTATFATLPVTASGDPGNLG